jgi:hypothetical protein
LGGKGKSKIIFSTLKRERGGQEAILYAVEERVYFDYFGHQKNRARNSQHNNPC